MSKNKSLLRILMFCLLILVAVLKSSANSLGASDGLSGQRNDSADFRIIDLHSHPSQKIYLFNKHLWRKHLLPPRHGQNLVRIQIDTRQLDKGYYKGLITNHYLPEVGLQKRSQVINFFYPILSRIKGLGKKVEHDNMTNFDQLEEMMKQMEDEVDKTNEKYYHTKEIIVAKSFKEFEAAIDSGRIPFAHALEGAHSLGRVMPYNLDDLAQYKKDLRATQGASQFNNAVNAKSLQNKATIVENLIRLKQKGVCLITLAHFFSNDIVANPAEGISYDEKKSLHLSSSYDPDLERDSSLTVLGATIVNTMFQQGMLVDLAHMGPYGRKKVMKLNEEFNRTHPNNQRPLVVSHCGVQSLFNPNPKYANYKYYDLDSEEIAYIKKCNGIIGIIPENFWLVGADTHLNDVVKKDYKYGIKFMLATIDSIHKQTGTYENIGIGSDFDGLADCPKDLYCPAQFGLLIQAMRDHGILDEDIKKITYGNALRVLKAGWADPVPSVSK